MKDKIGIQPQPIRPFKPAEGKRGKEGPGAGSQAFENALAGALRERPEVKFSAHALERLRQRELVLKSGDLGKIDEAVEKARQKGVHSSLVLLRDVALVASVKNSTIITAVDKKGMRDHVFTGIDGAVIII